MAHFAELDENNNVINVVVISTENCLDSSGVEQEYLGVDFCKNTYGLNRLWVQTSYNSKIRKNFASIGGIYDKILDAFIPQKPSEHWVLDTENCIWVPPIPYPDDGAVYMWDESSVQWKESI